VNETLLAQPFDNESKSRMGCCVIAESVSSDCVTEVCGELNASPFSLCMAARRYIYAIKIINFEMVLF
jgi:hypothetical protein